MAHVDDLTFVNAAQLEDEDNLYLGRFTDALDPDKRTDLAQVAGYMSAALIGPLQQNANGYYVRLENGLQICWRPPGAEVGTTEQTAAPWRHTPTQDFTFPAPFTETPAVVDAGRSGVNVNGLYGTVIAVTPTTVSMRGYGVNTSQGWRFGYVAIGRWK